MRAKNEFRLISEAYNIKLLAEKAVDGTLMCSKDCCGSPVMECKCGDDCPHCNCFMIQKAVKDFGLKSPLLEGIVPEDERDEPIRNRKLPAEDYERFENPYDDYVDDDAREQARRDDELMGDIKVDHDSIPKRPDLEKMQMRMVALDKEIEMAQSRKREDNEEPTRSITGMKQKLDALAAAQLAGSKHKPYVSSFVGDESDGFRKIFAVLGSDGKIVHKTRDKREAHQWLKDNYENI